MYALCHVGGILRNITWSRNIKNNTTGHDFYDVTQAPRNVFKKCATDVVILKLSQDTNCNGNDHQQAEIVAELNDRTVTKKA